MFDKQVDMSIVKIISKLFWGIIVIYVSYRYNKSTQTMKEDLEANLLTKHLAGWCNEEEEAYLKKWLTQNPQHQMTLAVIRQQLALSGMQVELKY